MRITLCFALIAGSAFAQSLPVQTAPETPVRGIKDVKLGMSHDHVLAGLNDNYELTRIDDPKDQTAAAVGSEYWMVFPKSVKNSQDLDDGGAVRFLEGKVSVVEIELYTPRGTGESTRFAEQFFWLLYNRAEPPVPPDELCGLRVGIGMSKDGLLSELGKRCEVQLVTREGLLALSDNTTPVGMQTSAWCVSAEFPCSHVVWFQKDTLSAVKLQRYDTRDNPRLATLPIELENRHNDKGGERLEMNFTVVGQKFRVSIIKRPGETDHVTIEQILCCAK